MPEFMMLMKGAGTNDDWDTYVKKMIEQGKFRGGSALGNGVCVGKSDSEQPCVVTGFMRFDAENIDQVRALLEGNPVYEAGGEIELLELIEG